MLGLLTFQVTKQVLKEKLLMKILGMQSNLRPRL